MSSKTLYTFGYLSGRSQRILQELIATQTPIVDVRFMPKSIGHYTWNKEALEQKEWLTYYWLQDLGNELYKDALTGQFQEPNIRLHDEVNGLIKLAAILDRHGRAALMCACSSKKTCHRIMVADLAKERLEVQVIHL